MKYREHSRKKEGRKEKGRVVMLHSPPLKESAVPSWDSLWKLLLKLEVVRCSTEVLPCWGLQEVIKGWQLGESTKRLPTVVLICIVRGSPLDLEEKTCHVAIEVHVENLVDHKLGCRVGN